VLLASVVAGVVCREMIGWLGGHISWKTLHGAFVDLCLTTIVGVILTVTVAKLLGVKEVDSYLKRIKGPILRMVS
jgi:hypothetical protein